MNKRIGIVGGVGWRATVDYYAILHEIVEARSDWSVDSRVSAPFEVLIDSLDLRVALALLHDGETAGLWTGFDDYHRAALRRLESCGVEVALIASNTPHERLSEIARSLDLQIVDLFEAVAAEASLLGGQRMLVLGTPMTMQSARLRTALISHGIEPLDLDADSAVRLRLLIDDLQHGRASGAGEELLSIVRGDSRVLNQRTLVGLHCTELPIALPGLARSSAGMIDGIRFLNPSVIHVEEALRATGYLAPSCAEPQA